MPPASPTTAPFTAPELAILLGWDEQRVWKCLRLVLPTGHRVDGSRKLRTYAQEVLPGEIRTGLADVARRLGFSSVDALRNQPKARWMPEPPIRHWPQEDQAGAMRLRRALHRMIGARNDAALSSADLEAIGAEDFRREFSRTITGRWVHELFQRIVSRDRGFEEFQRLELYLPEKPSRKAGGTSAPAPQDVADDFPALVSYITGIRNPVKPSPREWRGLWHLTFEEHRHMIGAGVPEKALDQRLRDFFASQTLFSGLSRDALLKKFNREKIKRALALSQARQKADPKEVQTVLAAAHRDGREDNGEAWELPEEDRDLLVWRSAIKFDGRVFTAWEELLRLTREFSSTTQERYARVPAKPGYVPASVMLDVRAEVELIRLIHQGPRNFALAKGYTMPSWENIPSLYCMSGDDVTFPIYWYIPDGEGWFRLVRGQCLIIVCPRSQKILGWSLQPDRNYSAINIRRLCDDVFKEYCVPGVLLFEHGSWESQLLKGKDTLPFSAAEAGQGLRELGVQFVHTNRPQGKGIVERIIGLLQDHMADEPGYCGRDERRDCPEVTKRNKQLVELSSKDRRVHPAKVRFPCGRGFYSFEEWNARLGEIIAIYNARPNRGRHLQGLSPNVACEQFVDSSVAPIQFDARFRLYFATAWRRVAKIGLNGFTLTFGTKRIHYRGTAISHLIGKTGIAFFDVENPDHVILTNEARDPESAVLVEANEEPGALDVIMNPDSPVLGREQARINGQASHWTARYNVLKRTFALPHRPVIADARTTDLCARANQLTAAAQEKKKALKRSTTTARNVQRDTGVALPSGCTPDDARILQEFMSASEDEL